MDRGCTFDLHADLRRIGTTRDDEVIARVPIIEIEDCVDSVIETADARARIQRHVRNPPRAVVSEVIIVVLRTLFGSDGLRGLVRVEKRYEDWRARDPHGVNISAALRAV